MSLFYISEERVNTTQGSCPPRPHTSSLPPPPLFIIEKVYIIHPRLNKEHTIASFLLYSFSNESTNILTFSSLSKNAPNSSESTLGMAPLGDAAAATTTTGLLPDMAIEIFARRNKPKYPPMMAAATILFGGGRELVDDMFFIRRRDTKCYKRSKLK